VHAPSHCRPLTHGHTTTHTPHTHSVGQYELRDSLKELERKPTSLHPPLASLGPKSGLEGDIRRAARENLPSPGTYSLNAALGRHLANQSQFKMHQSAYFRERAYTRRHQREANQMYADNILFDDRRSARRLCHLALYF
jgi:hypothetical protein